jgi:D-inositol-3-phosphate glycosyltransferase
VSTNYANNENARPQSEDRPDVRIGVLTGGADRPYAFGLATALVSKGVRFDLIANDELECAELVDQPGIKFLNLRGDQRPDASAARKAVRVLVYYAKLLRYAVQAKPKLFHILWNNRFEWFDRTLLMLYYRILGKRIVLTLHNINAGIRDNTDTLFNRLTLRCQYGLADHLFVHTEQMKLELMKAFNVAEEKTTVIAFGINNSVPRTNLLPHEAKQSLGVGKTEKVILFYGHIAPYKGLEYLVSAFAKVTGLHPDYKLVIAGRPKNCDVYWRAVQERISKHIPKDRVLVRAVFIPDEETEVYFKAADVVVLPYTHIYQSGVLFLAYSFGVPVLASDVGSLKDDIIVEKTGFVFAPEDCDSLAHTIERYFSSHLYQSLDEARSVIADHASNRNSWNAVADTTINTYVNVLNRTKTQKVLRSQDSAPSLESKIP